MEPVFLLTLLVLELSHQEFKTTMINMLRDLVDKIDSMQEQMGDVNRDGNA